MSVITNSIALAAPYYNLILFAIAIILFLKLIPNATRRMYALPWNVLFVAVIVFLIEQLLSVLRQTGIVYSPVHINGFFQLVIASLLVYCLLIQKEHVQHTG